MLLSRAAIVSKTSGCAGALPHGDEGGGECCADALRLGRAGVCLEAAYGSPAPKPACLDGRPPWDGGSADTPHMRHRTFPRLCHAICHTSISSSAGLSEGGAAVPGTSKGSIHTTVDLV